MDDLWSRIKITPEKARKEIADYLKENGADSMEKKKTFAQKMAEALNKGINADSSYFPQTVRNIREALQQKKIANITADSCFLDAHTTYMRILNSYL